MARPSSITLCSFCGKSHAEVKKLIAGPGVYICDNCVVLCKNVLDREMATEVKKAAAPTHQVPKPLEIRRTLDQHCIGQDHAKKTLSVAVHNHYKRILQEPAARSPDEVAPARRKRRSLAAAVDAQLAAIDRFGIDDHFEPPVF